MPVDSSTIKTIVADACATAIALGLIWADGTLGLGAAAAIGGALIGLHLGGVVGGP